MRVILFSFLLYFRFTIFIFALFLEVGNEKKLENF